MLLPKRLQQEFFQRHVLDVAKGLIGKTLICNGYMGIITETEAYRGQDDPASHAARGYTKRSSIMFGQPGLSYVYLIYGIHHCFNVVAEQAGCPAAVLIRSIILFHPANTTRIILNGPGVLCKYLGITRELNGIDLNISNSLYIAERESQEIFAIQATERIGISKNKEAQWRFVLV